MSTKIQQSVIKYMPVYGNILSDADWNRVTANYHSRVAAIPEGCTSVVNSSSLIDLLICSMSEDEQGKSFRQTVTAINREFEGALCYCNEHPQFIPKIKNLIKKALTEMDANIFIPNSAFKNWINELYVFNLLTRWDGYELVDVERPLGNGSSCDYVCRNIDGEEIWFEVVTFQRIDPSKQDDSTTMVEFISNKIEAKYKTKIKNILPENIPNLRILPIIEYAEGLERFNIRLNSDISTEPFSIMKNSLDGVESVIIRPIMEYLEHIRMQKEMG